MRTARKGEYTCNCAAYEFPHRFGGGTCNGMNLVYEQWNKSFASDGECYSCNNCNKTESPMFCEVIEGLEEPHQCPAWFDFVDYNGIKIYSKERN